MTVFLNAKEGGSNTDMPPQILERLRPRGAAAGVLIADRFLTPSTSPLGSGSMNWENHRWLRLRSTMGSLKDHLSRFARTSMSPELSDVTFDALLRAKDGTSPRRYPIAAGAREKVAAMVQQLARIGDALGETPELDTDLPKPLPHLVVRASLKT